MLQMHERLDGSGYPNGLAAEQIDLSGRILGVADVFVAHTNPRSYRDGARPEDVLDILHKNLTRYDERVIDALEHHLAQTASPAPTGTDDNDNDDGGG